MNKQEIVDVLKTIDPFTKLDDAVLVDLCSRVSVNVFKEDTYIFKQGDHSLDTLFIIVSGLVEIIVTSDRGVESVVGLRRPGDFFSETVVLSRQRYTASTRAREDAVCICISRTELEALIYNYPGFSSYFNELLAERMRLLYEKIQAEQNHGSAVCFDLPLFRKRVSEIMSTSVVTCRVNDQVADAARIMADKGISSAVVLDDGEKPVGLLTVQIIVESLITNCTCPVDNCTAGQIMNPDLVTITPDAFTGQALVALSRKKTKYILVVEREKLVGILTAVDLIRSRNIGNLTLLQDIETKKTLPEIARASQEIDSVLNALLTEGAKVSEILEVMSELHERLVRAVIKVSEKEMEARGLGSPPVDYCWINMGSDARHEQTLRTDQDNGMIYADPEPDQHEAVDGYFKALAELIVNGLDACGFDLCTGGVMATNPKWRRSVSQWCSYVENWSTSFDPGDTITMTILLDFRPIWGNQALARRLWDTIFQVFEDPEKINHMLTNEELKFSIPINFMGNLRTEKSGPHKNQLNIKTGGLVHLVNGMRIFGVNNGIMEPSTLGRLKLLTEMGVIPPKKAAFFKTAFETLVMFRIRGNLQHILQNRSPDNYIDPSTLTNSEQMLLKDAMYSVSQVQKLMFNRFSQTALNFFS
ncbi:MAG: DUF294 nucleotidyltransferase-like domain-containing protein [Pseudomonadota bacterium]